MEDAELRALENQKAYEESNKGPSVTWICGYWPKGVGFYRWLAEKGWDEAEAIKVAAGDKGSRVHLALERILSGEEFRIDTKVQDKGRSTEQEAYETELTYEELLCVKSFLDWRVDTEQDYIMTTTQIHHRHRHPDRWP